MTNEESLTDTILTVIGDSQYFRLIISPYLAGAGGEKIDIDIPTQSPRSRLQNRHLSMIDKRT